MGLIGRVTQLTAYGGIATLAAHFIWTRNSVVEPLPTTDSLFASPLFKKYNPNQTPVLRDVCIRKVPLSQLDPRLLEKKGKLIEAFCAGVYGGLGYAVQRQYLASKYQGPSTAHQVWSTNALLASSYDVGTEITDHFEVLEKTENKIIIRCGDSPLKRGLRDSDGLFELSVDIKKEEGNAVFYLKSIFFNSLEEPKGGVVMPYWMELLHREYDKIWMESGLRNVYA